MKEWCCWAFVLKNPHSSERLHKKNFAYTYTELGKTPCPKKLCVVYFLRRRVEATFSDTVSNHVDPLRLIQPRRPSQIVQPRRPYQIDPTTSDTVSRTTFSRKQRALSETSASLPVAFRRHELTVCCCLSNCLWCMWLQISTTVDVLCWCLLHEAMARKRRRKKRKKSKKKKRGKSANKKPRALTPFTAGSGCRNARFVRLRRGAS